MLGMMGTEGEILKEDCTEEKQGLQKQANKN